MLEVCFRDIEFVLIIVINLAHTVVLIDIFHIRYTL